MMTFKEFCQQIEQNVASYLPEESKNVKVYINTVDKNNGLALTGLVMLPEGKNVSPTIYLESYYEEYKDGKSMCALYQDIVDSYECHVNDVSVVEAEKIIHDLANEEQVFMKVINYKENESFLKETPHTRVDDLAVYYCLSVRGNFDGEGSIRISNSLQERMGFSTEKLHELAMKNTKELYPPVLSRMECTMFGIEENLLDPNFEMLDDGGMYVLTNEQKLNGATVMMYPEVMNQARDVLKEDYYIIPSSVHECLLIRKSMIGSEKDLGQLIRDVNREVVSKEDYLSNHAYDVDFTKGTIQTVRESLPRELDFER